MADAIEGEAPLQGGPPPKPRDPIWDQAGPVFHWLGLGRFPPEGLHGQRRQGITRRHTRYTGTDGVGFARALVRSYPANREKRLMALLRPQRLDDQLWRMIYAVMVTGGPIRVYPLVKSLTKLVSDHKTADVEAVRLYQLWSSGAYGVAREEGAES